MTINNFPEFKTPNLDTFINELKSHISKIDSGIDELLKIENKTYENFYIPYGEVFDEFSIFSFPIRHLEGTKNTDELSKVYTESLPIQSEWSTELRQREDIYQAVVEVSKTDLTKLQRKVIDKSLESSKLSGIGLPKDKKDKLKEINLELSTLTNSFSKNVLKSVKEYKLVIDNEEDVKELPKIDKNLARQEDGTYVFTLKFPSYSAYMKYGTNEKLRKDLHKAYTTKALQNEEIIEKILTLKSEKSKILGFENFAELSLAKKMVDTPDQVINFLDRLSEKSLEKSKEEKEHLDNFANKTVNPWDRSYYINKMKKEELDFDEEIYKPYFEQSNVTSGLFDFLDKTFGLNFVKSDTPTWDDKATAYDVYRNDNLKARVYLDLESRDDKKQGAWMDNWDTYCEKSDGSISLPIAFITCNFTPSTDDQQSLLGPRDVETLFHEMGHVLQHICSEIKDENCSGINGVEWDAVEWSSQFLELFIYETEVIKSFAKHYETGETISTEMIDKLNEVRTYRSATAMIGQSEYGLFDMLIHKNGITTKEGVQEVMDGIRTKLHTQEADDYNKFQCSFSHIFAGGYSAGYFSYKWAEVLSADCFLTFKERGVFNKENCDKYYDEFLSQGSSKPSMELFENYMGRKPDEESLIKVLGIDQEEPLLV